MSNTLRRISALLLAIVLFSTLAIAEETDPVIATYKGGEVKVSDVNQQVSEELNAMISTMNYIYQMNGSGAYTATDDDIAFTREYIVNAYIKQQIIISKLSEYGLSDLTQEEKDQLQSYAEYTFMQYAYPYSLQYGYSYDEAAYALAAQGITLNAIYTSAYYSEINNRLTNAIPVNEEVSDDEINEKYLALVDSAEKNFSQSPAQVESLVNSGSLTYFMPEGARYVKHIILIPEDEALMERYESALSDLSVYELELATITSSTYQPKYEAYVEKAILDECKENIELSKQAVENIQKELLESVQSEITAIKADLENGKTFDELIETYSDDPGSKQEPIKSNGYLVHPDSTAWDEAFIDAAVSLNTVGDVSEPQVGTLGVYIVKFESEPETGKIDLETAKDEVVKTIIADRRKAEFNTLSEQWVNEADIQLNFEAWK